MSKRYTEREWREIDRQRADERARRDNEERQREHHDRMFGYYTYRGTDHDPVWHPPVDFEPGEGGED